METAALPIELLAFFTHMTQKYQLFYNTSTTGAHNRNRTDDLFLTKEVLYRLSYVGMERAMGIEPTLSAWKAEVLPLNYARMSQ